MTSWTDAGADQVVAGHPTTASPSARAASCRAVVAADLRDALDQIRTGLPSSSGTRALALEGVLAGQVWTAETVVLRTAVADLLADPDRDVQDLLVRNEPRIATACVST